MAILFSSLLIWVQVVIAAATSLPGQAASCCECRCGRPDCCVTGGSDSTPLAPAAPQRSTSPSQVLLLIMQESISLVLPGSDSEVFSTSPSPPRSQAGPLYQRHCALLI